MLLNIKLSQLEPGSRFKFSASPERKWMKLLVSNTLKINGFLYLVEDTYEVRTTSIDETVYVEEVEGWELREFKQIEFGQSFKEVPFENSPTMVRVSIDKLREGYIYPNDLRMVYTVSSNPKFWVKVEEKE